MVPGRDLIAVLLGYLVGSLPFAQLISRWRTGQDIRIVGSGNAGARNVWHAVGPAWGLMVGALDIGKGLAAVALARVMGASVVGALLSGPAAMLGHDFPVFHRFRGGKGLATAYGVLLAWVPYSTLVSMVLFALAQLFEKLVSGVVGDVYGIGTVRWYEGIGDREGRIKIRDR